MVADRTLDQIKRVVVHCSDSEWGDVDTIRGWHKSRGWSDIGYHYVITNAYPTSENYSQKQPDPDHDGIMWRGRPVSKTGAHVRGHNGDTIGVCLIGRRVFSAAQLEKLRILVEHLEVNVVGHELEVVAHYELDDGKTCPNIDGDWLRQLFARVDFIIR